MTFQELFKEAEENTIKNKYLGPVLNINDVYRFMLRAYYIGGGHELLPPKYLNK